MLRKLLATTVVTVGLFGLAGIPTAGALTLPPGDGALDCGLVGSVRVARPVSNPAIAKVIISGKVAGCSYNGVAVPFVTGTSRSVTISDPASVCAALADGSASAHTAVTIKVNGVVYSKVVIDVDLDVSPSAPGSLVQASATTNVNGIAISANVTAQTDRPLADLCNGATKVAFLGTASVAWDRP